MIYLCDVEPLLDPVCFAGLLPLVSRERREKITERPPEKEKCRTLAAGLLLRQVCIDYGISDGSLAYGEHGKPYFAKQPQVHFNLSHSGMRAMCVTAQASVGCDVQEKRKISPSLLQKALSPEEYTWCIGQSDPEDAFFRLWVRKESYLKATGRGLSQPLDSFCIRLSQAKLWQDGIAYTFMGWQETPYYYALCQQEPPEEQSVTCLDLRTLR